MKIDVIVFDGFTLQQCEIEDTLEEYYKLIKCDTIQGLSGTYLGRKYGIDMYLDDNGKLYGQEKMTGAFVEGNKVVDPIIGNMLFLRHDEDGNSISVEVDDIIILSQYIRPASCLVLPPDFKWKTDESVMIIPVS